MFPNINQIIRNSIIKIRSFYMLYSITTLFFLLIFSLLLSTTNIIEQETLGTFILLSCISYLGFFFFITGSFNFIPILAKETDKNIIHNFSKNIFLYSLLTIPKEIVLFSGIYYCLVNNDINQFLFFDGFVYILLFIVILILQFIYYSEARNFTEFFDRLSVELNIKSTTLVSKTALIEFVGYIILLFSSYFQIFLNISLESEYYDKTDSVFYEIFNFAWEEVISSIISIFIVIAILLIISQYILRIITGYKLRKSLNSVL